MKTKVWFILPLIILFGCEKDDSFNPHVDNYINLLLTGSYTDHNLPAFSISDIPALLKYRNDTTTIRNFPKNPIASLWMSKCSLGMYAIWTIESIRAVEIESEYLIMRFPSQTPVLALRSSLELKLVFDFNAQYTAAKAYDNWWHSSPLFKNKMKIDPLKDTEYRWH